MVASNVAKDRENVRQELCLKVVVLSELTNERTSLLVVLRLRNVPKKYFGIPKRRAQAIVRGGGGRGHGPRSDRTAKGHPLKDLNHLLDCPASQLLRRASFSSSFIFKLLFKPCSVA